MKIKQQTLFEEKKAMFFFIDTRHGKIMKTSENNFKTLHKLDIHI